MSWISFGLVAIQVFDKIRYDVYERKSWIIWVCPYEFCIRYVEANSFSFIHSLRVRHSWGNAFLLLRSLQLPCSLSQRNTAWSFGHFTILQLDAVWEWSRASEMPWSKACSVEVTNRKFGCWQIVWVRITLQQKEQTSTEDNFWKVLELNYAVERLITMETFADSIQINSNQQGTRVRCIEFAWK